MRAAPQNLPIKWVATVFGGFFLVMGLAALAFAGAFTYFARQADEQVLRYQRDGQEASGQVVRKWKQAAPGGKAGSTHYMLTIRFKPSIGVERESVAVIDMLGLWRRTREGDRVDIRYLPGDPEWVLVRGDWNPESVETEELVILYASAALMLALAGACFWVRRRYGHIALTARPKTR